MRKLIALFGLSIYTLSSSIYANDNTLNINDTIKVCKALISFEFDKRTSIMRVYDQSNLNNIGIEYNRPDDNKLFQYRCKIEGDKALWAMVFEYGPGRWRPESSIFTFKLNNNEVNFNLKYSDGSTDKKTVKF